MYNSFIEITNVGGFNMIEETLKKFSAFNQFTEKLKQISESESELPLSERKWSIKEVAAHLYRWDIFLLETAVLTVKNSRVIDFPSHDEYNRISAEFAKTISFHSLLDATISTRSELVMRLTEMNEILLEPITINGYTHDPITNERYTFQYLIKEFSEHDEHHARQIEEFLSNSNSVL
jgi:hypothetical protein